MSVFIPINKKSDKQKETFLKVQNPHHSKYFKSMFWCHILSSKSRYAFLALLCFVVGGIQKIDAKCRMYGMVNETANKAYDGDPKPITGESLEALRRFCPLIAGPSSQTSVDVCCDEKQLEYTNSVAAPLLQIFSQCPQCQFALTAIVCSLVCHPNQADFVDVTLSEDDPTIVIQAVYKISTEFTDKMYSSCENVRIPQDSKKAISLLCVSGVCDGKAIIEGMLSSSPFLTIPQFIDADSDDDTNNTDKSETGMNEEVFKCYQEFDLNGFTYQRCLCQHCEKTCPDPPTYEESTQFYVFGNFTPWGFSILVVYVVFILTIMISSIITFCVIPILRRRKKLDTLRDSVAEDDFPSLNEEQSSPIEKPMHHQNNNNNNNQNDNMEMNDDEQENENIENIATEEFILNENVNLKDNNIEKLENEKIKNGIIYVFIQKVILILITPSLKRPIITIFLSVAIAIALSVGLFVRLQVTSDPVDLWSPASSVVQQQKNYFDKNFGGFYRTQQIILSLEEPEKVTPKYDLPPIISKDLLKQIDFIINGVFALSATYKDPNNKTATKTVNLKDICLQPLHPKSDECVSFSIMQYFQNSFKNVEKLKFWYTHMDKCLNSPSMTDDSSNKHMSCLSTFLAPIDVNLVLGGYPDDNYAAATATVITFVVSNHESKIDQIPAAAWEAEFIKFIKNIKIDGIKISYTAERSVEDEIERLSTSDFSTAIISYTVMFIYVTFALGKIPRNFKTIAVDSKVFLGLVGVILVVLSVTASIGFFCFIGVKINMITLEVLPFLILAVGVDNIFLIVHSYYKELAEVRKNEEDFAIRDLIRIALKEVGPGMLISAVSQISIFALGALSSIPVVHTFSLFASLALAINFFLQITCFMSTFVLDCHREMNERWNLLFCLRIKSDNERLPGHPNRYYLGPVRFFIKNCLSKVLLNKYTRMLVLFLFGTLWFSSLFFIPSLKIGLDQTTALPTDSYLQDYFSDVFHYMKVGAPVYFVVKDGYEFQKHEAQNKICSQPYCDRDSMTTNIYMVSRNANVSGIATSSNSWIDGYLSWLKEAGNSSCCRILKAILNEDGKIEENIEEFKFCDSSMTPDKYLCIPCIDEKKQYNYRPTEEEFGKFLPWFLQDVPNLTGCTLGYNKIIFSIMISGRASYHDSVVLNPDYYTSPRKSDNPVLATNFMAYHTTSVTSDEFNNVLRKAIYISKNLTEKIGHEVFPYSVFYVFYQSYLDIIKTTLISMAICCGAVLIVSAVLFSFDWRMTLIVSLTIICMDLTNALGMYITGMEINPITVVNLIMLLGINVEFVTHIARGYISSIEYSSLERARYSLVETGCSVFSGIAMTKFIGVTVLAFANSLIFRIYYFKMYSIAILVGTFHGLIFLPVALSYFGPRRSKPTNVQQRSSVE